jgi:PAS domain S-box-containing protein
MKLKQQITLMMCLALLVPAVLIGFIAIYKIQSKAKADIEEYRTEEYTKLKLYLKHITDIAYGIVEVAHKNAQDSASTISLEEHMEVSLEQLAKIRFDQGKGYFWVTNNKLPYPTMLMHAEKANLKGQVLDDPKHNVEKFNSRNIYQVRAELANANGDAFVEYVMKKPGTEEVDNKISYSRLYAPLGWIISTGFYTDQIEEGVALKKEALRNQIGQTVVFIVSTGLAILAIGLFAALYFSNNLTRVIILIKDKLKELSLGNQVDEVVINRKDEVGDMTHSLNAVVSGLKSYTSFAKEIGKGNLEQTFEPLSNGDLLGNELLVMRNNLNSAEKEKNLREWSNEGLARLGEVLRSNNQNTQELADEILKDIVKYLKANQGALFLISDENSKEPVLELAATYAYDKKKYAKNTIELGNGLAGQCALERSTIYLKEIPKNYIHITSGLGHALPNMLILVPLIHAEKVYGVLEMASFKSFEEHEIKFIEKIAESIASTVSTVQVNERTKKLLEQSQQMQEELRSQEEEVRQNMEELSATQEQMNRQIAENAKVQADLKVREGVFALTTILSEADVYGNILMVNDKLCQVSKYYRDELIGKPHNIFRHKDMPKELFRIFWETIKKGEVFRGIIKNLAKDGSHYWVDGTIVPVKDEDGKITKYIGARYHITDEAMAVELYNRQARKLGLPELANGQNGYAHAYKNGHELELA